MNIGGWGPRWRARLALISGLAGILAGLAAPCRAAEPVRLASVSGEFGDARADEPVRLPQLSARPLADQPVRLTTDSTRQPTPIASSENGVAPASYSEMVFAEQQQTRRGSAPTAIPKPVSRLQLNAGVDTLISYSSQPINANDNPFFLPVAPATGAADQFQLHARQSYVQAVLPAQAWREWTCGGQLLAYLHDDELLVSDYGVLVYYAYAEIKNDAWRFVAGLHPGVFNPTNPESIYLSRMYASGNTGVVRGQVRAERRYDVGECSAVTCQVAVTDSLSTFIADSLESRASGEHTPNLEGRIEVGWGYPVKLRGVKQRPLRIGCSAMLGEVAVREFAQSSSVSHTRWAVGTDCNWLIGERLGFRGEGFWGTGLADYGGGILQFTPLDSTDLLRTRGGFLEAYAHLTDCCHAHLGYGIDDTDGPDQSSEWLSCNQTCYLFLAREIGRNQQVGTQIDFRRTDAATGDASDAIMIGGRWLLKF